jgi:hypothetical protein
MAIKNLASKPEGVAEASFHCCIKIDAEELGNDGRLRVVCVPAVQIHCFGELLESQRHPALFIHHTNNLQGEIQIALDLFRFSIALKSFGEETEIAVFFAGGDEILSTTGIVGRRENLATWLGGLHDIEML